MLTEDERDRLYRSLYSRYRTHALRTVGIQRDDVYGAFAIFVLSVVATLPVALPFLLSSTPLVAMRLSNLIAIAMLFGIGFRWAKYVYANPWKIGSLLALIGVAIVLIAIPLGG
jgi:VIT1/CCC1 family predicted Fe2+/Mn2+ transporter